jgi:hypothetical protein
MDLVTKGVRDNELVVEFKVSKWRLRWEMLKALARVRIQVGRGES